MSMKCIQVLPILKHTFSEELTYWTTHDFSIGDCIEIPLNTRKVYAIVSSIVSLSEAKEFIKSRDFKIRKIETYTKINFFSNAFIKACLHTSKYYLVPFGEIFSEYIPKKILEHIDEYEQHISSPTIHTNTDMTQAENTYIQKSFTACIADIEELQKKYTSIGIMVPTIVHKKYIERHLTSIEGIHICTPIDMYLLDQKNIDVCVIAYAGSEYYRHIRKHFDTRTAVRAYCTFAHIPCVEMDAVLPIYADISLSAIHTDTHAKKPAVHLVDQTVSKVAYVEKKDTTIMKKPEDDADFRDFFESSLDVVTHKKLKLISPELYSLIRYAEKQKEDIFIYTTRKGLSSSISCSDCGHVMSCQICHKPYILEQKKGVRVYSCRQGHEPISIDSPCPVCGSIHLQSLGSGTEALEQELAGVVSMPISIVDSNTATQAQARNIFKKRKEKDHSPTIYISTELGLHQSLGEKFAYGAIASIETLFAIPHPETEIEIARRIESMREKISDHLIIQTRTPSHVLWKHLAEKSWLTLTARIQQETRELSLPPHTTYIQIQSTHSSDMTRIHEHIQGYSNIVCTSTAEHGNRYIHIYIKHWPDIELSGLHRYLKSLPKHIHVEVDSQTLM